MERKYVETGVGKALEAVRNIEGLTQYGFANKYGLSRSTVTNIECGYGEVSNKIIHRLIDIFGEELFRPFLYTRRCRHCGKVFEPDSQNSYFCGKECYFKHCKCPEGSFQNSKKRNKSKIAEFEEEARSQGLSYGQYQLKKRIGEML